MGDDWEQFGLDHMMWRLRAKFFCAAIAALILFMIPLAASSFWTTKGSAVVGILVQNEVVVAADSKEMVRTLEGSTSLSNVACKIVRLADGFFFAVAGVIRIPTTGFDSRVVVRQAHDEGNTFDQTINAAEIALRASLQRAVAVAKARYPRDYKKLLEGFTLSVLFVGRDNGTLFLRSRTFTMSEEDAILVTSESETFCPPECTEAILIGDERAKKAMTVVLQQPQKSAYEAVRNALVAAIDTNVPTVGPPIDILRIPRKGPPVSDLKPHCSLKGEVLAPERESHKDL